MRQRLFLEYYSTSQSLLRKQRNANLDTPALCSMKGITEEYMWDKRGHVSTYMLEHSTPRITQHRTVHVQALRPGRDHGSRFLLLRSLVEFP